MSNINKKLNKNNADVQEGKVTDVICGMELDPVHTKLHVEYKGEVYYFCNTVCKNHFVGNPEKYVG